MDRTLMIIFGVVTMGCLSQSSMDVFPSKDLIQVVWCEDNKVDPTTIIMDEYVRVSPSLALKGLKVSPSREQPSKGVFNVAHTLSIGGNFLQGIRAGTEVHLTVVDNDDNEVDCTDLGELLGLELDEEIFIGSCSYDLPATEIAGVRRVDLLSIPAGTELDLDLVDYFNDYFQGLSHAHVSISFPTSQGTVILCGDFRLKN